MGCPQNTKQPKHSSKPTNLSEKTGVPQKSTGHDKPVGVIGDPVLESSERLSPRELIVARAVLPGRVGGVARAAPSWASSGLAAIAAGVIEHVGLSNCTVEHIVRAEVALPAGALISVQNEYSMWVRQPERDGTLEHCQQHGQKQQPLPPGRHLPQ